jgi:hypothetical protein
MFSSLRIKMKALFDLMEQKFEILRRVNKINHDKI